MLSYLYNIIYYSWFKFFYLKFREHYFLQQSSEMQYTGLLNTQICSIALSQIPESWFTKRGLAGNVAASSSTMVVCRVGKVLKNKNPFCSNVDSWWFSATSSIICNIIYMTRLTDTPF
ncbi:hypothetical protein HanHA300_Chr16g0606971 [Helianthus annuus]|nr:hypothetical protein HanHA300_Chr16g0606971 [Helianthus annuus]KAJ0460172.1 hypothetical protein HanHA89_Chr16g0657571 [Helianthus annuus]KAJ0640613.1 hypothetical protein HanLR1_Chr16g0617581 [Helianthus annuus]